MFDIWIRPIDNQYIETLKKIDSEKLASLFLRYCLIGVKVTNIYVLASVLLVKEGQIL